MPETVTRGLVYKCRVRVVWKLLTQVRDEGFQLFESALARGNVEGARGRDEWNVKIGVDKSEKVS